MEGSGWNAGSSRRQGSEDIAFQLSVWQSLLTLAEAICRSVTDDCEVVPIIIKFEEFSFWSLKSYPRNQILQINKFQSGLEN